MLLQLALFSFAILWVGSPWQLSFGAAFLACLFFAAMIVVSALPAMFREWGNIKNALVIYIIIQAVCLVLAVVLPGIGQILAIAFNVYLFFRPVSFYKNIGSGFIFFFLWFIGINNVLGNFILEDPRGVFGGNVFLSAVDWVILVLFIAAFARALYHTIVNYRYIFVFKSAYKVGCQKDENMGIIEKTLLNDAQDDNSFLTKKEKKTGFPLFLIAVFLVVISLFIQPSWKKQVIDDLNAAFTALSNNDFTTARVVAQRYYNEDRFLFNGDVFFLNGIVHEEKAPQNAIQFFTRAADWYDNHNSWICETFHGEVYYRLSLLHFNSNPPDYYRARIAIQNAVRVEPENQTFADLQSEIIERVSIFEERENIGFFRRIWNNFRAR
ncbi:MAG: hypothetical protein FWC97_10380 [Treponema sp.]|nr:hypothetical protein [Treponema sp.]